MLDPLAFLARLAQGLVATIQALLSAPMPIRVPVRVERGRRSDRRVG